MDSFKPSFEASYESDYLHYQSEKFWEIRVYSTNKTFIRCGRLRSNAQEDTATIQTVEKSYNTIDEARQAAKRLIALKIGKGYQYLQEKQPTYTSNRLPVFEPIFESRDDDESLKRPPPTDLFSEDVIMKQVKLDATRKSSSGTERMEEEKTSVFEEEFNNTPMPPSEYRLDLSNINAENKGQIFRKVLEMGVDCAFEAKSVVFRGKHDELETLKTLVKQLESQEEDKAGTPVTIKINPRLSQQRSEIEDYAKRLGLTCQIGYDNVVVIGDEERVEAFQAYLIVKEEEVASAPITENKVVNEEEFVEQEIDTRYNTTSDRINIEYVVGQTGICHEIKDSRLTLYGPKMDIINLITSLMSLIRGTGGNLTKLEEALQKLGGTVKERVKDIKSYLAEKDNVVQYPPKPQYTAMKNGGETIRFEMDLVSVRSNERISLEFVLRYVPSLTYEYRDPKFVLTGPRETIKNTVTYMITYITATRGNTTKLEEYLRQLNGEEVKERVKDIRNYVTPKDYEIHHNYSSTNEDDFVEEKIKLTGNHLNQRAAIENTLIQSGLRYAINGSQLYISGSKKSAQRLVDYLEALEKANMPQGPSPYAPLPGAKGLMPPYPIDKPEKNEYRVTDIDVSLMDDIKKKGEALKVVATYARNSVIMFVRKGQKPNPKFLEYITKKKLRHKYDLLLAQNREKIEGIGDYAQFAAQFEYKKITLKPIYKGQLSNVKSRANELMLICEVEQTILVVAGAPGNIAQFKISLQQLEGGVKNTMHPKYWDRLEERPFAMIRLEKGTPEYEEVAAKFFKGVKMEITDISISRIQNAQFMEQHIENINTRMQKKLIQDPAHRTLLFQTDVDPVDTKYEVVNLNVPQGIYLSESAVRGIVEDVTDYQKMYLSDVYIGQAIVVTDLGTPFPYGFDSMVKGENYVIFDRLQSYPLYEIEFKVKENCEDEGHIDELC